MIFVAVRRFSDIAAAEADVQQTANTIWTNLIEAEAEAGNAEMASMIRWLSGRIRGSYRPWVEIARREPTPDARQRISGCGGYRFSDTEDASRFAKEYGMRDSY